MTCLGCSNNSIQYKVQWTQPGNIDSFDLDHYELAVGDDVMNVDAKENSLIVSINTSIPSTELTLIAVDRCGMNSPIQYMTIGANCSICMESKPSVPRVSNTTHMDCTLSGGATAGIAVTCIIIFLLLLVWAFIATVCYCQSTNKGNHGYK